MRSNLPSSLVPSSLAAICLLFASAFAPAQAQADFYQGKTVSVVIGCKNGSLALSAQIVAQHLGRYIPGNPTVIFRQMPGGAHLGATGYVYTAAEADGLTILAANPGVAMAQLAGLLKSPISRTARVLAAVAEKKAGGAEAPAAAAEAAPAAA